MFNFLFYIISESFRIIELSWIWAKCKPAHLSVFFASKFSLCMHANSVKNGKTTWDCPVSKTNNNKNDHDCLFFLYFVILFTGNKTIISYVLALQTQQPKTVKILNLHTKIQRLPFYIKINYPSSPVRKVLTVSPKNCS